MATLWRFIGPALWCPTVFACGSGSDTASEHPAPSARHAAARQACVEEINEYRATEGLPPLSRWIEAEGCAEQQARRDAGSGEGHANFGMCDELAQNTCPGYSSADAVVDECLAAMWAEGPGDDFEAHGHYLNMSNPDYAKVACSFVELADGTIWSNQNFSP